MIIGHVYEHDDGILTIVAPYDKYIKIGAVVEIKAPDPRVISTEQRKKIYALLRDISYYTGYDTEQAKGIFKYLHISKTGCDYFSLSNCSVTTAREFTTTLIDFCIEWGVPCLDSLADVAEDIQRYLYKCLEHRVCVVCGGKADVHHVNAIGMGQNRKNKPHLGAECIALCRVHHNECHNMGNRDFFKKYHVAGTKLDKYLCKKLGVKI